MPSSEKTLYAAVDAGGTTFKCGLATSDAELVATKRFPTSDPIETISSCCDYFLQTAKQRNATIKALGIGSFGPIDIDPSSDTYGAILNTPKPGWSGINLRQQFNTRMNVPVRIDTDVNAALAAEMAWGGAKGVTSAAYITVGTGIGAGIFANGDFLGKPKHPEFGHIQIKRHPSDTSFTGICPIHGDCLEGLASAASFTARHGSPESLPRSHSGWTIQANYLAQACVSLSLSLRVERIILGGGLMLAPYLLALVRSEYAKILNGYLGETEADIRQLITTPLLGDNAGLLGGAGLVLSE
ncbi:MAG: ROK family protein [Henriciella sp.]|nr:ROK family protein [Henriciella sp.]